MIINLNDFGGQGGGGGDITVDSQMSDTSTNPVQNKVIKQYVDSHSGGGGGDYIVVSSLDDITSPKYGMKAIVDGTEYVYIQGNPDADKSDRWIPTTIIITNPYGEITDEDKLIYDLVHSKAVCDNKGKDERADAMTPDYLIYGELPFSVKMSYGGNAYFDVVQLTHNFWDNWVQLLYFENGAYYFTRNISKNGDDYYRDTEGHTTSTVTSRGWAGNMPFCISWNNESGEGAVYLGGHWDEPDFKVDADHPSNYEWFGFPDYLINGQLWNGSFSDAAGVFVPYYPVKIRMDDEMCTCLNPIVCINESEGHYYEIKYIYIISGFRPVTLICSYDENYNCIDVIVEG